MVKGKRPISIKDLLNFKDIKLFLDETSTALIAFSIFLAILMGIFEADYLKEGDVFHNITIFALFFIILFIGFFIMSYSTRYNNVFVRTFGFVILLFPIFFVSFLEDGLTQNLIQGGYTLVMLVSIVLSTFLMNMALMILQNKKFKNSSWFAISNLILAIFLFLIIKYTSFVGYFAKLIVKIIPFSNTPDVIQVMLLGLLIGVFIGLVLAPAFVFLRKFFPTNKR